MSIFFKDCSESVEVQHLRHGNMATPASAAWYAYPANASISALASWRSEVSNPSVNQL